MIKTQKIDLFRFVGEELYQIYRRKNLKLFPGYDTGVVREDTDIYDLVYDTFVKPYRDAIANGEDDLHEDLQYIISSLQTILRDYDRIQQESKQAVENAYMLSVAKALEGDTGA